MGARQKPSLELGQGNWVRAQGPGPPPTTTPNPPGKALRSEPSQGHRYIKGDGNHSFPQQCPEAGTGNWHPALPAVPCLQREDGVPSCPPALGCLPLIQPEGPCCGRSSERATWGPGRDEGTRDRRPLDASTFLMLQTLFCYLCSLRGSNPPQRSCLENPMYRGAWQAVVVHGVAKSQTL